MLAACTQAFEDLPRSMQHDSAQVNDESRQQVEERLQIAVRHSDLELESAGNIRFVYGKILEKFD